MEFRDRQRGIPNQRKHAIAATGNRTIELPKAKGEKSMTSYHMSGDNCGSCAVCGSHSLRVDEVNHFGRMLLSECKRCHHRWTEQAATTRRPMLKVFPTLKIASAA